MLDDQVEISIKYTDDAGARKSVEFQFPSKRRNVLGNLLGTIERFDPKDVTYGFIFLKGEPHPEVEFASQPTVYVKVSPDLPKAEDFKKMLVRKVTSIWKDHMEYAESDRNIAYVPNADMKEESLSDFIAKGRF